MENRYLIISLFFVIMGLSIGCLDSQKSPVSNEIIIATPDLMPSPTEKKIPVYNETKTVEISVFFETWSRGKFTFDFMDTEGKLLEKIEINE